MAGTTKTLKKAWATTTATVLGYLDALFAFYTEHNKVVTDLETLRGGMIFPVSYTHADLAAGADIAARAVFQAKRAVTVQDSVVYIPEANSVGVDGTNTLVLALRNITEGVDIATATLTTNLTANTPVALTLTAANADIASGDVLGIVVTQGVTADVGAGTFQFELMRQTVDAAGDLTASTLSAA